MEFCTSIGGKAYRHGKSMWHFWIKSTVLYVAHIHIHSKLWKCTDWLAYFFLVKNTLVVEKLTSFHCEKPGLFPAIDRNTCPGYSAGGQPSTQRNV